MARTTQLSKEKQQSIITLRQEGQSSRKISRTLNVSSAVAKTIKRYDETGSHEDRPRTGRPRVTSAAEDKFIRVTSLRNRQLTAPQIRAHINALQSSSPENVWFPPWSMEEEVWWCGGALLVTLFCDLFKIQGILNQHVAKHSAATCHPIWFALSGTIICISTGQWPQTHLQAM